jgi:hypothetical protein
MGTLEMDPKFHGLRPLFSWMQSYFDACSDSIKPCIFYLSIFSAEKNIRRRRLLWRWIAEGYCRDTSDGRTCEENGEIFISELVNSSIVQQSPNNEVLCQINGFFLEYIISRPMEDNLVFALEMGCSLNSTRAGQHLTIRSTWNRRDEVVYESIDFSRLRSLTVFGKWESFFISSKNVNMRLLRVLDLEDATDVTNEDLEQIAKLLPRLKFLSLRGHTKITCLPISMGGLRQLQTLDIRGTSAVTLPLFITKLQKLRYIRAGTSASKAWDWEGGDVVLAAEGEEDRASSSAQVVTNLPPPAAATPTEGGTDSMGPVLLLPPPAGSSVSCSRPHTLVSSLLSKLCRHGLDNGGVEIGKLSALHTLGVLNVNGSCGKFIFKEIKKLTQLRKLSVSGINKGNIQEFCEAISDHAHLKSLSVELDKYDNLDGLDDIPQPPNTLHSLKLYGRVNKLLVWIEKLRNNLEKLKLDLTIEKPEELRAPRLSNACDVHLIRIRPIQNGELLIGPGWNLVRVVEIQCSSALHIKFDDRINVWWRIQMLKVHFSGGSQSSLQISGLSGLTRLKELWLKGYTDAHKQCMQRQIDDMELRRRNQERPVLKLVQTCSS